jgi:UrcA family protein
MFMTIARYFLGAAVSVLSLAATAAQADTTLFGQSRSQAVAYKDLNLNQPRDVARLFDRISSAADRVCGPRSYGGYPKSTVYQSCYSDAVARAVAHIDRPALTAYFQQRTSDSAWRNTTAQQ